MDASRKIVARARARLSAGADYAVDLETRRHALRADEPPALGGGDAGPAPFELLLASLGACTAITLRMYAQRKGWPLESVGVALTLARDGDAASIDRAIELAGPLDDAQRARLADVAERTPVTLALKGGLPIATRLSAPDAVSTDRPAGGASP